ncbi:hypothetical protein HDF18_06485 [Mucilaginibacter sp. X5P1]|uniref:hypothetical protein n=1 Tax=Mucilaginibacter sp. X5P1 TaxID=2723088 RepID=UPI00161FC1EA|nr:hypothetical protein [Mucilaginibacter sp. X5P1]MBB6137284.1 hypothetical protein [Mucilaginibacter sp. X5P1]
MYSILDTKNTNELYLVRKGWFSREIELTDNTRSYGKIVYHRLSKRIATVITASNTWIFKRAENSYRLISVTDENGEIIGTATRDIFSRITTLSLQTGFVAKFYKPSVWSRHYVWESDDYGKIMNIDSHPFGLRDSINIDQSMAPESSIPFLTFFGSYLVILKRRRNNAIVSGLLYSLWGGRNIKRN